MLGYDLNQKFFFKEVPSTKKIKILWKIFREKVENFLQKLIEETYFKKTAFFQNRAPHQWGNQKGGSGIYLRKL